MNCWITLSWASEGIEVEAMVIVVFDARGALNEKEGKKEKKHNKEMGTKVRKEEKSAMIGIEEWRAEDGNYTDTQWVLCENIFLVFLKKNWWIVNRKNHLRRVPEIRQEQVVITLMNSLYVSICFLLYTMERKT